MLIKNFLSLILESFSSLNRHVLPVGGDFE